MPRLKYFNNDTQEWEYVIVGGQGPQGIQGEPGVVSATDPIIYNAETQNVSFGSPDYITFDTTPETSSTTPGTIFWDNGEGTPTVVLNSNVNLNLGQENVALCYNGTGSTIANGSVVYISGAQGQRPRISLADADTEATSSKTFGMATEDIANGAEGFVTTFGIVNGINTSTFTEGQALWLSQTAGQVTATRPLAPAHTVFVGYCLKSNAASGRIFINPQNGYELNELHDVLIEETVADNELIARDATSGLWKNQTAAEAGLSEIGHVHSASAITSGQLDVARGGTGATTGAGLVPIIPSSVTVGSGSASIATDGTVTFTSCNYFDLASVFSSVYANYKVIFETVNVTAGDTLLAYVLLNGGSANGSNFTYQRIYSQNTTIGTAITSGQSAGGIGVITGLDCSAEITIFRPNKTQYTNSQSQCVFVRNESGVMKPFIEIFYSTLADTTQYNGIRFYDPAGSISGKLKIYGYN